VDGLDLFLAQEHQPTAAVHVQRQGQHTAPGGQLHADLGRLQRQGMGRIEGAACMRGIEPVQQGLGGRVADLAFGAQLAAFGHD